MTTIKSILGDNEDGYSYKDVGPFTQKPLQERIKEAISHAEKYGQMDKALWAFLPCSMTIGEVLRAALKPESGIKPDSPPAK